MLVTTNATQSNASTTKCGMARNHFTSHCHRLRSGSRCASTRTGYNDALMRFASRALLPPWLDTVHIVRGQSRPREGLPAERRGSAVGDSRGVPELDDRRDPWRQNTLAAPAEHPFDSADAAFDEL